MREGERERQQQRELRCYMFTVSCFLLTSRTAVNSQTGVCTPAGGIVTSKSSHFQLSLYLFRPLVVVCVITYQPFFSPVFPSFSLSVSSVEMSQVLSWRSEIAGFSRHDNKDYINFKQRQLSMRTTYVLLFLLKKREHKHKNLILMWPFLLSTLLHQHTLPLRN